MLRNLVKATAMASTRTANTAKSVLSSVYAKFDNKDTEMISEIRAKYEERVQKEENDKYMRIINDFKNGKPEFTKNYNDDFLSHNTISKLKKDGFKVYNLGGRVAIYTTIIAGTLLCSDRTEGLGLMLGFLGYCAAAGTLPIYVVKVPINWKKL